MPDISKIDLNVGGTFPGEQLLAAMLNYATKTRETMEPETRAKWDAATYQAYRDWNNFWVEVLHWPGTKLQ